MKEYISNVFALAMAVLVISVPASTGLWLCTVAVTNPLNLAQVSWWVVFGATTFVCGAIVTVKWALALGLRMD